MLKIHTEGMQSCCKASYFPNFEQNRLYQQILMKASHVLKTNNISIFRTKDNNGLLTLAQYPQTKISTPEFVALIFGYMNANDVSISQLTICISNSTHLSITTLCHVWFHYNMQYQAEIHSIPLLVGNLL